MRYLHTTWPVIGKGRLIFKIRQIVLTNGIILVLGWLLRPVTTSKGWNHNYASKVSDCLTLNTWGTSTGLSKLGVPSRFLPRLLELSSSKTFFLHSLCWILILKRNSTWTRFSPSAISLSSLFLSFLTIILLHEMWLARWLTPCALRSLFYFFGLQRRKRIRRLVITLFY